MAQASLTRKRVYEHLAVHVGLIIVCTMIILPFAYVMSMAFKPVAELWTYPPNLFPKNPTLDNFVRAWNSVPFAQFLFNSAFSSIAITLSQLVTCSLAAYAFSRIDFYGREILFIMFLGTMMIPTQVTMIPTFLLMRSLGWVDTYQALIVPFMGSAFGTFLLRQHFLGIPQDLEDASRIDGCSRIWFLMRVIVPLSKPALTTLAIFTFMWSWNQYLWPLIITNTLQMRTIQIGVAMFMMEEGSQWNLIMSGTIIVMLPTLLAFLSAQSQFVKGITMTGLKG